MNRITKTIPLYNGKLFAEMDSRRIKLYDCMASVDIQEHSVSAPVLGKGKVIDKRNLVLLITFDHAVDICIDGEMISRISGFSFCGDVIQQNGSYWQITFDRCLLEDDLDITDGGSCRFEVQCSQNLINELRRM